MIRCVSALLILLASGPAWGQSILVFDANSNFERAVEAAELTGIDHTVVTTDFEFLSALATDTWDLVVIDAPSGVEFSTIPAAEALVDYVAADGRVLLGWWDLDGTLFAPLADLVRPALGIDTATDFFVAMEVHAWDDAHPIFNAPNPIASPIEIDIDLWADNGDRLVGLPGTIELGGFLPAVTPGEAAIVLGNEGRTLVNGFVFDDFEADQIVPFAANEMLFLLFGGSGPSFLRGDANHDGGFDISDPVFALAALFVIGSPQPTCFDSADANDDGAVDVSDAVFALSSLFVPGAPPLPPPFVCGGDPTDYPLTCAEYLFCP